MSFFKRVKSETFEGAEPLARVIEEVRSISHTPVEREFDAKWAKALRERILDGFAVTFNWAVAEMAQKRNVLRLRVNGQHSSFALSELLKEGALPDGLAIHLDTYSVPDEASAVLLFRQFDERKSARSKEDISGAYQCFQPDLVACNRSVLKVGAEGVTWYRREVQRQPVDSGDDVYKLFNEKRLHPFFLMINELLAGGKANELKRMPIMAATYGTWLEDARQSAEFWRFTSLGANRNVGDAAADLDDELLRIRKEKEIVNARDLYAKCAKAWAAFGDNSRVTNFKVNTKKKDLPSLGEMAA
jgi:hypothetical protein